MGGLRGEHEQTFELLGARAGHGEAQHAVAETGIAVGRCHRQTRQFGSRLAIERIHGAAGKDQPIVLQHEEAVDLLLEALARSLDQHALLLEWFDQLQDSADIVDGRLPQFVQAAGGEHGANTVVGEHLAQQGAVGGRVDQVRARDASAARANRIRQINARVAGREFRQQRLGFGQRKFGANTTAGIDHPVSVHQEDEFVGTDRGGSGCSDVLHREVEDLPGRRVAQRRQQDDLFVAQAVIDCHCVDFAHPTGELQIHALDDPNRLRSHEVAAGDADVGTRHRCVGQSHGQRRLQLAAHLADRLFHALERRRVGDPQITDVAPLELRPHHAPLDMRPHAVDDHEAYAEALQQVEVVHQTGEGVAVDHVATEGDNEHFAAKRVDVGRGRAKPIDELLIVKLAPAGRLGGFSHPATISQRPSGFKAPQRW